MLTTFAIVAGVVYAGLCALLYLAQDRLLYFPTAGRAARDVPVAVLPRPSARVLVSTHEQAGSHAVLYFGGNAEDVSLAVDELARAWPDAAIHAMHYRGYGGSDGRPREADLVADALALAAQVRERHPQLTLVGRSLGSGIAVQVAARAPHERLVLVTPYDSIVGLGAAQFPWLPVRLLAHERYDSGAIAPSLPGPVTIIAAADDTVVPPWSTQRLFTRFRPGVAHMAVIDHRGHNDIGDDPRYLDTLRNAR